MKSIWTLCAQFSDETLAEPWCATDLERRGDLTCGHWGTSSPGPCGNRVNGAHDLGIVEIKLVEEEVVERLPGQRGRQRIGRKVPKIVGDDHVGTAGLGGCDHVAVVGGGQMDRGDERFPIRHKGIGKAIRIWSTSLVRYASVSSGDIPRLPWI